MPHEGVAIEEGALMVDGHQVALIPLQIHFDEMVVASKALAEFIALSKPVDTPATSSGRHRNHSLHRRKNAQKRDHARKK